MHRLIRTTAAALTAALLFLAAPSSLAASDLIVGSAGSSRISGLPTHAYGQLTGRPITSSKFVNIETTVAWSKVANGDKDSSIKSWANALKGKGNVLVSFSHEPMAKQNTHWGSASSFVAAFRHVVTVFNAAGAGNVEWVWNATSDSFRGGGGGANWYPGDAYVDDVAGEAYNKYQCGFSAPKSFGSQIKEILAFAGQHHKRFVVAEYASNRYSGRAQWLRDAHTFAAAHSLRGMFYYNRADGIGSCNYRLSSAEEGVLRSQ